MMILLIVLLVVQVGVAESVRVDINAGAPNGTLLKAFRNPAVTEIHFKADYHVGHEFEAYSGVKASLPITRNVTVRGVPGQRPLLDLNYQYSVLGICSNCTFQIHDLALGNERRGTGVAVDFFMGQPGSVLLLNNTYWVRQACTSRRDAEDFLLNTPRSLRFPGPPEKQQQQITGTANATYDGVEYPDALLLVDAAVDVPLAFQELRGLQGGFTLVTYNTLRLCGHFVSDDCLMIKSPEACVNELIDALLNANNAGGTGGTGSSSSSTIAAIVTPVVVAVLVLAAAVAAFVLWHKQRSVSRGKSIPPLLPVKGAGGGAALNGEGIEAGNTAAGKGPGFDLGTVDHDHDDHNPAAANRGWVVSSSCTASLLGSVSDEKIQFGVLVGAGTFGKVYKGWWAGRDVAIKVIEHDNSSAAAVENEVVLMLSFDHPNIVQAYHYITFTLASSTSNALMTAHGTIITTGDTTASSSSLNISRSFRAADSSTLAPSRSLLSNSSQTAETAVARGGRGAVSSCPSAEAAATDERSFSTQTSVQRLAGLNNSTLQCQQQQQQQPVDQGIRSQQTGALSGTARLPSPLPGRGRQKQQQQQQQEGLIHDCVDTHVGPLSARGDAGNLHHHHQQQQQHQQQQGYQDALTGLAACSSGAQQQQQQQQLVLAETGAAVRPGSQLPGSQACTRVSSSSEAAAAAANEWVIQGTPLGERIDTSRWPGIMEELSAATGNSSSKEMARAKTWLVLEYCDLGTLSHIASGWSPDHEDQVQMIQRLLLLQDTARGLQALHAKSVVHGDLNARNVLVSSSPAARCGMVAKLADLGLSRVVKQHQTHRTTHTVGTMSHMPPELLRYGRMSAAVDVFAFGVMMWEVFTGQVAFRALHYGQFFELVVLRNQRPPVPASMPEDYQLLME